MSLSTFLARPDVRRKFREEFPKPKLTADSILLAPPLSKRYSLVGTAFDYLLRVYLERRNPRVLQRRWIAEAGLAKLGESCRTIVDVASKKTTFDDTAEFKAGRAAFKRARAARDRYIASRKITDSLLKGVSSECSPDIRNWALAAGRNLTKTLRICCSRRSCGMVATYASCYFSQSGNYGGHAVLHGNSRAVSDAAGLS